ncbi:MAG: hypothetical protein JKY89_12930 [Immundisolibacteraceae bacterium]|nr:hypothetical protein [Immundisolibacteraceae bacterium]
MATFAASWKFGTYLNDNFEDVSLSAVWLMNGLEKVWESIKFGAKSVGKSITFTLGSALTSASELFLKTAIEISRGLMRFGGETGDSLAAPIRKWALEFRKTVDKNKEELVKSYDDQIKNYEEYKAKIKAIDSDTDNFFDEVTFGKKVPKKSDNKELTDTQELMKNLKTKADEIKNKIAEAINPKEVKSGNKELGKTAEALEEVKTKVFGFGKKTTNVFSQLKATTSEWKDQMADTFADMAMRGELTFKNIGKSIKNMVLSTMLKTGMSSLMGMIKIPGFAKGGRPEGLSMVGENGPEIVDFGNTGAYIKTANETRSILNGSGGSGSSVIIKMTNIFNDNVSAAVKQELFKALPILKSKIIEGVVDAFDRREISLA